MTHEHAQRKTEPPTAIHEPMRISVTRKVSDYKQMELAVKADFKAVEAWTNPKMLSDESFNDEVAKTIQSARHHSVRINSVVVPKSSTLEDFSDNARRAIKMAAELKRAGLGTNLVVADYPGYRGGDFREAKRPYSDIPLKAGERAAVRGALHVFASPVNLAKELRKLKEESDKHGLKFVMESGGGSDPLSKQLGRENYARVGRACHGFVMDLEHIAQLLIVQPLEEVHNPMVRVLRGEHTMDDVAKVFSFYSDYRSEMDGKTRKLFQDFLKENDPQSPLNANPKRLRRAAMKLYDFVKPQIEGLDKADPAHTDIKIIPQSKLYDAMIASWAKLPIRHIHLTGGHLGSLLKEEETTETRLGTLDKAMEHSYVVELPQGGKKVIGSKPGESLYKYLHIEMGGNLYPIMPWHELLGKLLKNRKNVVLNYKAGVDAKELPPAFNFEIDPALVKNEDKQRAKRAWDGE